MIRLQLLGSIDLQDETGRELRAVLAQPKRLALLGYLAAALPPGTHRRDALLGLFWPELDQEHARNALSKAVQFLRRSLGDGAIISRTPDELSLNPGELWVDVRAYSQALEEGRVEEALDLYRGDLLPSFFISGAPGFEEWLDRARAGLRGRAAAAARLLAERHELMGQPTLALACARRAAELANGDELPVRRLIELLERLGDRAGAVRAYEDFARRLASELEVEPSPDTAALIARVRASEERSLVPSAGVAEFAAVLRKEAGLMALHCSSGADLMVGGADGAGASTSLGPENVPKSRNAPRNRDKVRLSGGLLLAAAIAALGLSWFGTAHEGVPASLGTAMQLTFESGLEIEPALSPDGRFVAYSAVTPPGTRIYLRQPGGRALPIAPNAESAQRRPLWSPDGTKLLFLQGPDLAVVPALGGTSRIIVRGGRGRSAVDGAPVGWRDGVVAAAWSPDGAQVAYVLRDSLYIRSLDTGMRRLVAARADIHSVAWRPDARSIALAAGNVQYEGGDIAGLGNGGDSEILIVRVDGTALPVAVTGRKSLNTSPAWTPDGKHLLFISDRHGPRDVYMSRVDASARPHGDPTRVTTGLNPHTIALSADGDRIAYSAFTIKSNVWSVPISLTAPATTSQAVPITTGTQYIEGLDLSPDFKRLYFTSNQRGNFDIYRVDLPAGEPVQVTTDPAAEWGADESPDGRWLTFYSTRHGTRDIFVMPTDGGAAERVTSDPGEERYPYWSPDGSTLSFATDDSPIANGTFVISRNASGVWGASRQVSPHVGNSVWSADGRSILGVLNDRIAAVPLDGRSPRQLYAVRSGSPDPTPTFVFGRLPNLGGFIPFFESGPDGESYWGLPERGGPPRLLARANHFTDVSSGTSMRGIATDGLRLYFTVDERASDIFVAEVKGLQ